MKNQSWEEIDNLYFPKRKVHNKGSKNRPHIIGSFYSCKMVRVVEYQSLNECIFYYLLELDTHVERYYVQPLEVQIPYINDDIKKTWVHVPDVLVYKKGNRPALFQIKEKEVVSDKLNIINKWCEKYASEKGWNYSVIYPKEMPPIIIKNLKFLIGFLKKRRDYDLWTADLITELSCSGKTTIKKLADSFYPKENPLYLIPIIYYLISNMIALLEVYQ